MSGSSQEAGDRTEPATARHLEKAREAGNVPVSREAAAFAAMASAAGALYFAAPKVLSGLSRTTAAFLSHSHEPTMTALRGVRLGAEAWFGVVFPILLTALLGGAGAVLLQTGFLLHLGALTPRLSRVNPMAGLKRVFGSDGAVELVKSLAKLSMLLAALWLAVQGDLRRLMVQPMVDPRRLPLEMGRCMFDVLIAGLWVQAAIAGADLFWVRFRYARTMRMSRQDIRDEHRESEGNPQIKARIRRIRVTRARRRMMAAVPAAAVVVTNPTHFAVALAYDRARRGAPRIVAKGMDSLAQRIREVAAENHVPIVSNPPLARALYRLELDTDIPAEHYKAVAEIIAYVWRLRRTAG